MAASMIENAARRATGDELPDVRDLVSRGYSACVGKLASMTRAQFDDVIQTLGGRCTTTIGGIGRGVSLVVIGQKDWPLSRSGQVWPYLREARVKKLREGYGFTVLSERLFLEGLGMREEAETTHRLYTISTITDLLGVTRNQVRAWVKAGLVEPVRVDDGVWYFDFRQMSAASTICDLIARGVSPGSLRRQLRRLQEWLPDVEQPLSQLAAIEAGGSVLVRLAKGDLAADDGQLHFDFESPGDEPPATLRLVQGPTTKAEWHALGVEQEQGGYFAEAVESYRDALLAGGPDPQLVFDLARALHQLGKLDEAAERYRQVVEMDQKFDDAWNNLGVLLAQRDLPQEACEAFRRALDARPDNAMAHYNLADTLEEAGRVHEAADHWQAYLKTDAQSERAAYARRRLG